MIGGHGGTLYVRSNYGVGQDFPITKEDAEKLIVVLQHYVRTGDLGVDTYVDLEVGTVLRGIDTNNTDLLVRITNVHEDHFAAEEILHPGSWNHTWICMFESFGTAWVVENQPLPNLPKTWHERIMED